ncbi:hypothetical protein [Kitasatospora sp. NPDC005748]|uniref:hypothetical protein n=1 Tax=Kitasatospora sp. NPDC005748 TaxID=3157063 RepID=UPI0033F33937
MPTTVQQVRLRDAEGREVAVPGRAELLSDPACLVADEWELTVSGWAGPWPATERWWADDGSRVARMQVTVADGGAVLLAVEGGRWRFEGAHDS